MFPHPKYICLLLLVLGIALSPKSSAAVTLRFANFPAAETFPCISMERWKKELQKRTAGAVTVQTFPSGTLLDAKNMVRGVMRGQADIGCISLAYHPTLYPLLSVFELPLGFSSAAEASAALWDTHAAFNPAETSKIKVIALFSSAPSQVMSTRPVKNIAELKGITLRSSGTLADIASLLGATPVSMPQSDTPEALQKGMVQGVFSSLDVLQDYNFAESCRFGLITNSSVYPFLIFMNKKTWDSLSPEVQKAIDELGQEHSTWTGRYVDEHGKKARLWAKETYGVELYEPQGAEQEAMQAEMQKRTRPAFEAWEQKAASKGIDARAVLEHIHSLQKKRTGAGHE